MKPLMVPQWKLLVLDYLEQHKNTSRSIENACSLFVQYIKKEKAIRFHRMAFNMLNVY
jgi:hypothetical protein